MARWLSIWIRAVIGPAAPRVRRVGRRAAHRRDPVRRHGDAASDLTGLAIGDPGVGAVLALTWLLVFVPIARGIVRGDGARYLDALPSPAV